MSTPELIAHAYTIDCEHDNPEEMTHISEAIDESHTLTETQKLFLYRRLARLQLNLTV